MIYRLTILFSSLQIEQSYSLRVLNMDSSSATASGDSSDGSDENYEPPQSIDVREGTSVPVSTTEEETGAPECPEEDPGGSQTPDIAETIETRISKRKPRTPEQRDKYNAARRRKRAVAKHPSKPTAFHKLSYYQKKYTKVSAALPPAVEAGPEELGELQNMFFPYLNLEINNRGYCTA